jgi:hypothetical protein
VCDQFAHSKFQGNAQGVGSNPVRAHNYSPDNDTGFAKMNDLYKTAVDDIQVANTIMIL